MRNHAIYRTQNSVTPTNAHVTIVTYIFHLSYLKISKSDNTCDGKALGKQKPTCIIDRKIWDKNGRGEIWQYL